MNKICTTIEQSKKLIELGVDKKTSDMFYWCGEDLRIGGYKAQDEEYDVSAWSLTALMELMPKKITFEYYFVCVSLVPCGRLWFCHFVCKGKEPHFGFFGDSPIDAAFEMVCYLLKNNKL